VTWRPEIAVDQRLATKLIHDQFPQLGEAEPLGEGWDYSAFRVGDDLVFRFPRRAVVLPGMAREIATLPRLTLPVQIPTPLYVGEPSTDFPWGFFGAPFIAGDEPIGVSDALRAAISLDLARTLRALHAHDPADLPLDANQRADMNRRVPWARETLAQLGLSADAILGNAAKVGALDARALCHGDLHFRQILVGSRLNGIIDWVDVCRANPAIDLSLLWSFVPREMFDQFLTEYGSVSEEELLVARVLALGLNAILANYARDMGNARLEKEALAAVHRAAAE
jgi:aminoglycoside phosphotransferase (APT) family kinase protein